jgi:hypothetical protein
MLFVLSFFFFTTGIFPGLYISGLKVRQQAQSFPLAPLRDQVFLRRTVQIRLVPEAIQAQSLVL